MLEDKFTLDDDAYWSDPWSTRKALQRPMMQSGQEAFLIGAPNVVALNEHDTFPLAILRVSKAASTDAVSFSQQAIVAVVDVKTYELSARLAFDPPTRPRTQPTPRPGGKGDSFSNDTTAMLSEGHTLDLATRLRLPLSRSEYIVTAICLDTVSNRCRMKLVESSGYQDPAVDEFLREYLASTGFSPEVFPQPGRGQPLYRRNSQSPMIPNDVGISMAITRVNPIDPATSCVLRGSYRLPVRQHQQVPPPEEGATTPGKPATAIVPITLLLTGTVDAAPKILPLTLPTYDPIIEDGDDTIVTGYFALDLCHLADLTAIPQTYFLYAFSGEVMVGPIPTAFVHIPPGWEAGRTRRPDSELSEDTPTSPAETSVI